MFSFHSLTLYNCKDLYSIPLISRPVLASLSHPQAAPFSPTKFLRAIMFLHSGWHNQVGAHRWGRPVPCSLLPILHKSEEKGGESVFAVEPTRQGRAYIFWKRQLEFKPRLVQVVHSRCWSAWYLWNTGVLSFINYLVWQLGELYHCCEVRKHTEHLKARSVAIGCAEYKNEEF